MSILANNVWVVKRKWGIGKIKNLESKIQNLIENLENIETTIK